MFEIKLKAVAVSKKLKEYKEIKRFEFYLKNGFVDTHYQISDNSDNYQILATTTQFPIEEYKLAIKQLSFGLYSPQIKEHTN